MTESVKNKKQAGATQMSASDPKGNLRALLSNPGETPGWGLPGGFPVSPLAAPRPCCVWYSSSLSFWFHRSQIPRVSDTETGEVRQSRTIQPSLCAQDGHHCLGQGKRTLVPHSLGTVRWSDVPSAERKLGPLPLSGHRA